MMTRTAINNSIWGISLLLQCSLLVLLFVRGLSRKLPAFTILAAFYPLRSAVLFVLGSTHLATAQYASTYSGLSLTDLLLQLVVAVSIAYHFLRAAGGLKRWPGRLLLLLPLLAWAAAYVFTQLLPANDPIPPDRLQIFDSLAVILLCLWAFLPAASRFVRWITVGFAFYGIVSLLTTAIHTFAAIHRDAKLFAQWSYILSAAYLIVVAFWIVVLKLDPSDPFHAKPVTPPTGKAKRSASSRR